MKAWNRARTISTFSRDTTRKYLAIGAYARSRCSRSMRSPIERFNHDDLQIPQLGHGREIKAHLGATAAAGTSTAVERHERVLAGL
ncbi:MAG TPA: hypothetical protein VF712_15115 [Thermoleophilaceae bacterium]